MWKLIMIGLLAMLAAGCASRGSDVRTDVNSGAILVESEKLGVGFFTVKAKTTFAWNSDAPEIVRVNVFLTGTKNISDVVFSLGKKEIKLHTDVGAVFRNSGSYSRATFSLAWADFMDLAAATAAGEVKVLVTGPGDTHEFSALDAGDYKTKLLPFIERINNLKKVRSPIS